ncbi:cell division inhibitor SepF [Lachnospiraceae bacterium A10]|jgi:cell division inhibitor SepF|nr:cell division inhibitor SepF [Lachnospiraceae bacterium A10]
MGLFDKFLDVMKLNDDEDDYYDDDEFEDDDDEIEEKHSSFLKRNREDEDLEKPAKSSTRSSSKITPLRSSRRSSGATSMEVRVIQPTSFEDAREIAETLLSNKTVILNMEGLDLALAQRIIDFTSGACYSIDGTLQKISNYIFILTPSSVNIDGDLQGIMNAFDFSGIQTGF